MCDLSDEIIERKTGFSPFLKQCTIAVAVLINNTLNACGMAFPAVLLPQLRSSSITLSREDESWVVSIMAIAMFVGNLLTVPAMRHGRKPTHYLLSLLNIAGWLIITLATDFQMLMIGRFVQGLSIGLCTSVMSVILAEYTSPSHRGGFLATISLSQGIGVFITHFVGSFLAWQDTALLFGCLPVISFAITVFIPESPSWLALEGRYDECRKAFRWLRGYHEENELNKMIQARQHIESLATHGNTCCERVRAIIQKDVYIPLVIGSAMCVMVTCCGSVILASYLNEIVGEIMGSGCNVVAWMGIFDGVRLLSNGAALYVVSRVPRRTLLFTTGVASVMAHLAIAAYVYANNAGFIGVSLWLPALLFIWHIITIGLGMVSVPFVILGEIFPLQYRDLCIFICTVLMVASMFVVLKTFPGLVAIAGLGGTWLVYGGMLTLTLTVSWRLLPETRGRTLQDIEEHFRGKPLVSENLNEKEALNRTKEEIF